MRNNCPNAVAGSICCWRLFTLMIGLGGNARADYSDGQAAFERQDYSTALYELEPLAAQGDGRAEYLVGIIYRDGLGVPQDYVTAYAWLHVAQARGKPRRPLPATACPGA